VNRRRQCQDGGARGHTEETLGELAALLLRGNVKARALDLDALNTRDEIETQIRRPDAISPGARSSDQYASGGHFGSKRSLPSRTNVTFHGKSESRSELSRSSRSTVTAVV
jgi:hypothetical protein